MKIFSKYRIILASQSPRRKELLQNLGFDFEVLNVDVDETYPDHILPHDVPLYLAKKKFDVASGLFNDKDVLLITADTSVICRGEIIGKPSDRNDAINKIGMLSGKEHKVITGVCIGNRFKKNCFDVTTIVSVDALSDEEISFYVTRFEVMDKAGAYGIQDWLGIAKISAIEGSYTNVIGLPTQKLWIKIHEFVENYP